MQGGDAVQFKRILTAYEVLSDTRKVREESVIHSMHALESCLHAAANKGGHQLIQRIIGLAQRAEYDATGKITKVPAPGNCSDRVYNWMVLPCMYGQMGLM